MSGEWLKGVWRVSLGTCNVSGRCLEDIQMVSGGCLECVRKVTGKSRDNV